MKSTVNTCVKVGLATHAAIIPTKCLFLPDSPDDCALAVLRQLADGTRLMMGHIGAEHARDLTTLMSK